MTKTAIQDVLGSQGDAAMFKGEGKPDLYNLWFDVPPDQRFSDEYNGEWGTLIPHRRSLQYIAISRQWFFI